MGSIHNLNARRAAKLNPAIDEVIDDEFIARRAMRQGQFDDGLTIPFDSLNPFPRPRGDCDSPRTGAGRRSPADRPRLFINHTETVKDCIAVIAIVLVLLVTLVMLP